TFAHLRTDVDLAHQRLRVHRSLNRDGLAGYVNTKGRASRQIKLHRHLVPILEAILREPGNDLLLPLAEDKGKLAEQVRDGLRRAGVRRATLFEETHTTLQIGFRELRNTGITWYAIEGMDVFRLHALAGHREVGTTMKYI